MPANLKPQIKGFNLKKLISLFPLQQEFLIQTLIKFMATMAQ